MSRYNSPLRYPGGKSFLSTYFGELIVHNGLSDGTYVEPFAGGAGIAVDLLLSGYVSKIILNDADRGVSSFWKSIIDHTEVFCRRVYDTPVTLDQRSKEIHILKNRTEHSDLDVGFATFFLNRTSRSGIIYGGPIGGYHQSGKWKLDARYYREALCKRIRRIALYRNNIKIFNHDAINFLKNHLDGSLTQKDKVFVYLDPPYYQNGKRLYLDYYREEDHIRLSQQVKHQLSHKWVLSYDDVPQIRELYDDLRQQRFIVRYNANKRASGGEIMIFSSDLLLHYALTGDSLPIDSRRVTAIPTSRQARR